MKKNTVSNSTENCAVTRGSALLFAVLFMGVLLSGAIYFGFSAAAGLTELCDDYYDGGKYDFGGPWRLDDIFFRSAALRSDIAKYEYVLFGRIRDEDIIVGRDGYLFDAFDTDYGYDYVRDYVGEFVVAEDEIDALAEAIRRRESAFEAYGIDYILAVIPNSQTVCGDKLPGFFGEISENSRLRRLSHRLADGMQADDDTFFLDLTDPLKAARSAGQLYNNTENSLNALGAYFVYRAIYDALPRRYTSGHTLLTAEELDFFTHVTDGRELARQLGLEKLIYNKTVSLPSNATKKYTNFGYTGKIEVTCSKIEYRDEIPLYPSVLLEFGNGGEWDRILLSEYFSNTFGEVGYRSDQAFSKACITQFRPRVVIQFVHEYALSDLTEASIDASYAAAIPDGDQ